MPIEFEVQKVDVSQALAQQMQPVLILHRAESEGMRHAGFLHASVLAGDRWCVPSGPIPDDGSPVEWSYVQQDAHVRVPMFGYISLDRTWPGVVGAAFQRGFTMAAHLPTEGRLAKLLLLIGAIYEGSVSLPDGTEVAGMEFWLGAAARLDN